MITYKIGQVAQKKGYSARRLAAEAGVSPNTAALLIKARSNADYNVCADVLDKVCKVLKSTPGKLLAFK